MKDSGEYWYDRTSAVGQTTNPTDNNDMISPAFWLVNGTEFKITRNEDPSHTALLHTTGGCLGGQTFRSKITSYGDFRDSEVWAKNRCHGNCIVQYGGQFQETDGTKNALKCNKDKIKFWCGYGNDGAVMTIGAGSKCEYVDHGIGITEADQASFAHDQSGQEYDFGNNAIEDRSHATSEYSLNLWVR